MFFHMTSCSLLLIRTYHNSFIRSFTVCYNIALQFVILDVHRGAFTEAWYSRLEWFKWKMVDEPSNQFFCQFVELKGKSVLYRNTIVNHSRLIMLWRRELVLEKAKNPRGFPADAHILSFVVKMCVKIDRQVLYNFFLVWVILRVKKKNRSPCKLTLLR